LEEFIKKTPDVLKRAHNFPKLVIVHFYFISLGNRNRATKVLNNPYFVSEEANNLLLVSTEIEKIIHVN
tara:strand:- start:706 stop:912 length:207 start_codon:yes stop_codon:yes gene_type:complete